MRPLSISEDLPCGCRLRFLPEADFSIDIPHEKPESLLKCYNELMNSVYPNFLPKRILEIGVKHGGSLVLWNERFDSQIVGIDHAPNIIPTTLKHFFHSESKVKILKMSATDPSVLELGNFDLVIDDGSHCYSDIVETFNLLWNKTNSGGLYVIEDWITDDSKYDKLLVELFRRMVGYWPSQDLPEGSPRKTVIYRNMIVLEKP